MSLHANTRSLHAGEGAPDGAKPLNRPIYASSTYVFDSAADIEAYQRGDKSRYLYSRHANPTVESAEAKIAELEGAEAALVTSSGMAAVATVFFGLLTSGDQLVCSAGVYGATLRLATSVLSRFGVDVRVVTVDELADPASVIGDRTRLVWFESPANPTLRCVDMRRVAEATGARGVLSVVDSTFATPINQQPLACGVDLVMHSATKYLNGHSDLTAGALAGSAVLIARLRDARTLFGGVLDPSAAYALTRGIKTLGVRMQLHNSNAMRVAEWLSHDRRVTRVMYPGLPSHPDYGVATSQMTGFGGMVTFDVAGGYETACRMFDRFRVIERATSLGGVETLCSLPVLTSHYGLTDDQLAEAGVTRGMVRLSIGLEDAGDLIADLDQALS
jgi:cystathionine beta-lyase/cystathionine gamma-synthase